MIRIKTNLLVSKDDAIAHLHKIGQLAFAIAAVLTSFVFSPLLTILITGLMIVQLAKPSLRITYAHGVVVAVDFCVEFGVCGNSNNSDTVLGNVIPVATADKN